jgi:hypothetical protein
VQILGSFYQYQFQILSLGEFRILFYSFDCLLETIIVSKNLEKVKNNEQHTITKISSIIIIIASIISVIGAFYIYYLQDIVTVNRETANLYLDVADAVEYDIAGLLQTEVPKIQDMERALREVRRINTLIESLKSQNGTMNISVTQNELEQLAVEAVSYILQIRDVSVSTYAYKWSIEKNGTQLNDYTMFGTPYYLIVDRWAEYEIYLQSEIVDYAAILYPSTELLLINAERWYNLMYADLGIVELYGSTTNNTALESGINLTIYMYGSLRIWSTNYSEKAKKDEQTISIMSTAILLAAISALIFGFIVQIDLKKLQWLSLFVGLFVAIIAFYMFSLAVFLQ